MFSGVPPKGAFYAFLRINPDGLAESGRTGPSLSWAMAEYLIKGKPSILGFCSGIVAGLVVITPACGFVTTKGAMIIGVLAGIVPFLACWKLKAMLGYDDALDTFGVHGVGGTMGALLTGLLASKDANPIVEGLASGLVVAQLKAIVVTILWSVIATAIIAFIVKAVIGLKPTEDVERAGLDLSEHGEEGYNG